MQTTSVKLEVRIGHDFLDVSGKMIPSNLNKTIYPILKPDDFVILLGSPDLLVVDIQKVLGYKPSELPILPGDDKFTGFNEI